MIQGSTKLPAAVDSSSANGTNGHVNSATDGYTPAKRLDINQEPDRVLFA
jgi:alkanesulfonate monooxygenase